MKKKKRWVAVILLTSIFLILINLVSALGVTPAIREYNFQPGLEATVQYNVFGVGDGELELSVKGDLAEYVTLDKDTLKGNGNFAAKVKLPKEIEVPGRHIIYVSVNQKIDEELAGTVIGTRIGINPAIIINVPYPGEYLELTLTSHDVNIGEPVDFDLRIESKGTKAIDISPKIDIYDSQGVKIETLNFLNRTIRSQEVLNLKKTLDTTNYNSGRYKAIATIQYSILAQAESDFRIGDLSVDVVNYTGEIPIGGLQPFDIGIESGWNNAIDGVYAEVSFLQDGNVLNSFKTTSTSLTPWEAKTITGYFDSGDFSEDFYDANITLFYYGRERGDSSSEIVQVYFFEKKSLLLWFIIGGVGLLMIIALVIIKFVTKKNGKGKKKK